MSNLLVFFKIVVSVLLPVLLVQLCGLLVSLSVRQEFFISLVMLNVDTTLSISRGKLLNCGNFFNIVMTFIFAKSQSTFIY